MELTEDYRVAVIDEDSIQLAPLVSEMRSASIDVMVLSNADEGKLHAESANSVDLYIVDIMLPSKNFYSAERTSNFTLTGLALARDIRKARPSVPILLFSNTSKTELVDEIKRVAKLVGNCVYVAKYSIPTLVNLQN